MQPTLIPGSFFLAQTLLQVWVIILGGVLVPGAKLLVWFAPETAPDVGEEAPLVVPSGSLLGARPLKAIVCLMRSRAGLPWMRGALMKKDGRRVMSLMMNEC